MASAAVHKFLPSIFRRKRSSPDFAHFFRDTCSICRHYPESDDDEASEQWCVLPCGHRFGNECLRILFEIPHFRHCPTCEAPATCACGHPVTPAALPKLKGPLQKMEMKRVRGLLSRQMDAPCTFCRELEEEHGDTVAVLEAFDLDVNAILTAIPESQNYVRGGARPPLPRKMEERWSTWWVGQAKKGPRCAKGCKDRTDYHYHIGL